MLRGFPFSRPDPFTPDWSAVRLVAGEVDLPGRHVASTRAEEAAFLKCTPELRVRLENDVLQATALEPHACDWTARSVDGKRLAWITEDGTTAYLSAYTVDPASPYNRVHEVPQQVRRLYLRTGQWLPSLTVPEPGAPGQVVALLPGAERIVVLVARFAEEAPPHRVAAYRLGAFDRATGQCQWWQELAASGPRHGTGVGLWAPRSPDYAVDAARHLSWMGEAVVVCAGPLDAVTCLDTSTGQVRWRTDRVWEFVRGFTGPSVWAHHLGRFGAYPLGPANTETEEGHRNAFNEQYSCAIVGGPLVLPYGPGAIDASRCKNGGFRIFVAVSRAAPSQWEGFLSECLVYELSESGEPIAVGHLPRMVHGSQARVYGGGIVWVCQDRGVLRLLPSRHDACAYGFPGSPSLLANVEWYRQLPAPHPDAWLTTGPAGDPHAFIQGHLVRTAGGGYISDKGDGVYRFPLVLMNGTSGETRPLTLLVPYHGMISPPRTNCSRHTGPDGKERIKTHGPWVLGMTGLESHGTRLIVTLGQETDVTRLEFDLTSLVRRP